MDAHLHCTARERADDVLRSLIREPGTGRGPGTRRQPGAPREPGTPRERR